MDRSSSYRLRWANLYRSGQGCLRTAAAAPLEGGRLSEKNLRRDEAEGLRRRWRNTAEKSGSVCRHNGLFFAIATVGETWDGIGQAVDRLRTRTRWLG